MIGDPGGKSAERNLLSSVELEANLDAIRPQLERFLDFTPGSTQAILANNADWLGGLNLIDYLRDVGKHFTVNQMVARDNIKSRLEGENGISYTEFSYLLLQSYDFAHLFDTYDCTVQLGGSDQWGNIVGGVDYIRRTRSGQAYGVTSPLLTKADGTKFGKTESGTVWLSAARTSPYELYQFLVRTEDTEVPSVLRHLTLMEAEEIEELEIALKERPAQREAQRALARWVTSLVHGSDTTEAVEQAAQALFSEEIASLSPEMFTQATADAPSSTISRASIGTTEIVDLLVSSELVPSKSAARTAIEQGGVYVNNKRVELPDAKLQADDLLHDKFVLLRRGKRNQHVLRLEA